MSATDVATVTLEIDGRELTVPKGTPLVLAAAGAGVEIPIFCYEPRLGPAIGACRMCLVEVEGMPKLQAACTMTAGDGMKVHTRSASAAQGQEAVLEFILTNHPLDCPVCDKGGECPLQDLTYRYGPGNTRFHLNKRTYEKPLAISPLIALDRERCILCYRCTRFSQDVAEDEQLVARERGATSVIATFEEQPYRGRFSGNVIELCPVGALTSTEYRFKARPWEITNVPSVCALCPTGCNTWASVREGDVRRVLSRNHPGVDEGWLCDKGRFAHVHVNAADRYLQGLVRGPRGLEPVTPEQLAETIARRLRHHASLHGPDSIAIVASGEQSNEEAHAWAELVRAVGGGALVSNGFAGAGQWDTLAPYAATIADLDRADLIVISGEREVGDAAGVLELRVRQAVRRGARLLLAGSGGVDLDHVATGRIAPGEIEGALRDAEHSVLIATEPAAVAAAGALAHAAGLADGPGGVIAVPEGPNERGLHALGYRDDAGTVLSRAESGTLQMLIVLGDADPLSCFPEPERWEAALQRCESVVASSLFPTPTALWAHVILPATAALEKDGTTTNLEGRTQRLRPVRPAPAGVQPELAVLAAAGRHLGLELDASPSRAFRRVAAAGPLFAGLTWEAIAERAPLATERPRAGSDPAAPVPAPASQSENRGGFRAVGRRPLFSGAAVARSERLAFQRSDEIVLPREDALRLGIAEGRPVAVRHAGGTTTGTARLSRTLAPGAVRFAWDGAPIDGPCKVEEGA
ncbi:MAG TPA: molybdopterin-dependent oxidoreductase [Gaiellales bacterium]|nr:molybdopterin-dependent oxidoreductase [Gaiellales bacterium]